jgi:hypothetical protein
MTPNNKFARMDSIANLIKTILEADTKAKMEELKGKQHKIDKNKNNKIDAHDFAILRGQKKVKEESEQVAEASAPPVFQSSYGLNRNKDAAKKTTTVSGKRVKGKGYDNPENERKGVEGNVPVTSLMPGHDERAAKFLARQAKGKLVKGKAQSATQKEEIELEEGSASKENQKTPYRDINSPESRGAASAQRKKMASADKADKGKKLLDKIKQRNEEVEPIDESDELNARRQIVLNKTKAGKEREIARNRDELKFKMKATKRMGGLTGPKGKLPEEVEQLDEVGDTPAGRAALRAVRDRADATKAGYAKRGGITGRDPEERQRQRAELSKAARASVTAGNRLHGFGPVGRMKSEEVELNEGKIDKLNSTQHRGLKVSSSVYSHSDERLYHTNKVIHRGTVGDKKFVAINDVNRGLTFQTNHSPDEKRAIVHHLKQNNYSSNKNEEVEQIDESDLGSQIDDFMASRNANRKPGQPKMTRRTAQSVIKPGGPKTPEDALKHITQNIPLPRDVGYPKRKMNERELSEPETAEKERIVKGMKKGLAGFKARYGEKAKSVMYATATKKAKESK